MLVFKLGELHVFNMFKIGNLFFKFFNFIEKPSIFKIRRGSTVERQCVVFAFPHFNFRLLLINKLGQFFILWEKLGIMFEDKINFFLKIGNFFVFVLEHGNFFNKTVVFSLKRTNKEFHWFVVTSSGGTTCSSISERTCAWSIHFIG